MRFQNCSNSDLALIGLNLFQVLLITSMFGNGLLGYVFENDDYVDNANWLMLMIVLNIFPATFENLSFGDLRIFASFYLSTAFFSGGWSFLLGCPVWLKIVEICLGSGLVYLSLPSFILIYRSYYSLEEKKKLIPKRKIY